MRQRHDTDVQSTNQAAQVDAGFSPFVRIHHKPIIESQHTSLQHVRKTVTDFTGACEQGI